MMQKCLFNRHPKPRLVLRISLRLSRIRTVARHLCFREKSNQLLVMENPFCTVHKTGSILNSHLRELAIIRKCRHILESHKFITKLVLAVEKVILTFKHTSLKAEDTPQVDHLKAFKKAMSSKSQ